MPNDKKASKLDNNGLLQWLREVNLWIFEKENFFFASLVRCHAKQELPDATKPNSCIHFQFLLCRMLHRSIFNKLFSQRILIIIL